MYLSDSPSLIQMQSAIRNATRIDQSPDDGCVLRNGLPMKVASVLPAETGTWTPAVPEGFTWTQNAAPSYCRIGGLCHLYVYGSVAKTGTPVPGDQFAINGLPFSPGGFNGGTIAYGNVNTVFAGNPAVIISGAGLKFANLSGGSYYANSAFTGTSFSFIITSVYRIA